MNVRQVFVEMGKMLEAFTWHMVYASKLGFCENNPDEHVMSLQIIQMLLYPVGFQAFLFEILCSLYWSNLQH